jgi:hypothetical protein
MLDPFVIGPAILAGLFCKTWRGLACTATALAVLLAVLETALSGDAFEFGRVVFNFAFVGVVASLVFGIKLWRRWSAEPRPHVGHGLSILNQVKLGNTLTRMTDWWEAVEVVRMTDPTRIHAGLNGLPYAQHIKAAHDMRTGVRTLGQFPRHLVTEAIIKNQEVSFQLGRPARAKAQRELYNYLVENGLALDLDTFSKSYS